MMLKYSVYIEKSKITFNKAVIWQNDTLENITLELNRILKMILKIRQWIWTNQLLFFSLLIDASTYEKYGSWIYIPIFKFSNGIFYQYSTNHMITILNHKCIG